MKYKLTRSPLFILKNLIPSIAIVSSVCWILLQSYQQIQRDRLTTDFISWALSGMAPIFSLGMPYLDYWGINPPGVLLTTSLWGLLFGPSLHAFHVQYLLSLALITYFLWHCIGKLFSPFQQLVIFLIFCTFFYSRTIQSQFFPSEINGLVFTLLGVHLLLKKNISAKYIFWAHVSFILAGQMKEVFAFTGLATFPYLFIAIHQGRTRLFQYLKPAILGTLTGISIILAYLLLTQSLSAYLTITTYKSQQFKLTDFELISTHIYPAIQTPVKNLFAFEYQLPILIISAGILALLYLSKHALLKTSRSKRLTIQLLLPSNLLAISIIVCYWIGTLIGYVLQNRYGHKYDMAPLLPTILLISIIAKLTITTVISYLPSAVISKTKPLLTFITLALISLLLLPQKTFIFEHLHVAKAYQPSQHLQRWQQAENPQTLQIETKITQQTQPTDCINAIYGWGMGSIYYYSRRPSCSKYFLINILPAANYSEYTQQIINQPASAIYYNREQADFAIDQFETNVFNYPKILDLCYTQDLEFSQLYWANQAGTQQSDCLKQGLPQSTT